MVLLLKKMNATDLTLKKILVHTTYYIEVPFGKKRHLEDSWKSWKSDNVWNLKTHLFVNKVWQQAKSGTDRSLLENLSDIKYY